MDYSVDCYIKKNESTSQSINILITLQFCFSYINKENIPSAAAQAWKSCRQLLIQTPSSRVALIEALTSIAHSRHLQTKVQAMRVAEAIPATDRAWQMLTKLKF